MSKTVLANIGGFTPVIDSMVENHGYVTALVFGVIWRYCQMKDGSCTASQQKIAKKIGLSVRTVSTHLDILVKNGYLSESKTPTTKSYKDTGKAAINISVSAGVSAPVAEHKNVDMQELHNGYATGAEHGMQQVHTKKEVKIDNKIEVNSDSPQPFRLLFDRFIQETGIAETMLMNPSNIENVKTWVESGITEEDITIAVKELRDKDYSIVRPASINMALNHIKSRKHKKNIVKHGIINNEGEIYAT